jgi:hypothetical protein
VKWAFQQRRDAGPEGGLSLFLAMYLLGLVGVLLGTHMLQPARGSPGSVTVESPPAEAGDAGRNLEAAGRGAIRQTAAQRACLVAHPAAPFCSSNRRSRPA